MTEPAGRVIFAAVPNKSRLEETFFKSDIKHSLVSYFYLQRKKDVASKGVTQLIQRIRDQSKVFFIDSGIFTMKAKFMGANIAGMMGAVPVDRIRQINKEIMKKLPYFVEFAKAYGSWLSVHEDMIDRAFDLDVDQFLGVEVADKFYQHLVRKVNDPKKIIRIWHSTRPFEEWIKWCESGEHDYLGVEGGGSHRKDFDFYNRFIKVAHKNNVKVHILAAADYGFLSKVNVDTGDSSSWTAGARYGLVCTPHGIVSYGSKMNKHWNTLIPEEKEKIVDWLKSKDLEWRPKRLMKNWIDREMANIAYFLHMDRPFVGNKKQVSKTWFLD